MNKNYYAVFTGIFLGICLLLCGGIWYSLRELYVCREEYDQLDAERHNNTGIITNLEARNASLARISGLSINSAGTVPDAVAFFSMLRQVIDLHKLNLLYVSTSGQDDSGAKDNTLQIKINGDYYAMAKMFADLRDLPAASKITRLSLKRNHDLPEELVEADLTIEVLTEE
ncbi:MAG: hypothetical protein IJP86_07040 [Synergistaceae bacterium]|nr:hypothetical protein [Synergistaceae bacterium]